MKRLLAFALLALTSVTFGATLTPIQLLNPAGSSAGQAIVSTGASTAPAWGSVAATALAAQAANTVVANITASSASPTAVPIPTCNTSTSALQYTPVTGWSCFTGSAPLASPAFTGTLSVTNSAASGNTVTLAATSNSAVGVAVNMQGNGASTPNKTVRVSGGLFQVINSGNSAVIFQLDDSGNLSSVANIAASGAITPSQTAGVIGTTTNNNANAGSVGEFPTPTNQTAISVTTGTALNVSQMTLTAGDWDCQAAAQFNPAGSTVPALYAISTSLTSATLGDFTERTQIPVNNFGTSSAMLHSPTKRYTVASGTATLYAVANSVFSTSTMTVSGNLRCRRPR